MLSTRASGEKRCDVKLQAAIKGWFEIGQDDFHQRIRVYRNKEFAMSDPKVGSASRYLVKSIDELRSVGLSEKADGTEAGAKRSQEKLFFLGSIGSRGGGLGQRIIDCHNPIVPRFRQGSHISQHA